MRLLQCQRAIQLAFGEFDLGARVRKLAIGLRGDRLERTCIDQIQEVARLDEGAVAELDVGDEAADAGANLNLLDRIEPARELVPVGDGSLDGLSYGDRRRWRGRSLRCLLFLAA